MKLYTIIGGVNGCGKSSLTGALKAERSDLGLIIDVDKLAAQLGSPVEGGKAAVRKGKRGVEVIFKQAQLAHGGIERVPGGERPAAQNGGKHLLVPLVQRFFALPDTGGQVPRRVNDGLAEQLLVIGVRPEELQAKVEIRFGLQGRRGKVLLQIGGDAGKTLFQAGQVERVFILKIVVQQPFWQAVCGTQRV